ncbi:MAG: ATP-binding protein [Chitinophagales bacterium]|jgi:predicted ATPase|uniref:ATP-binding protein n=1 Tax=Flavobacterium filum TaxID=370974 RepID=UPI001AC213E5|nr:ATP-binding protein [Flavobacterium filum]MBN8665650.1 ATP-binding protein [Chitinophagales bacterium]
MNNVNHKEIKTNWYVVTGGPCTGKTTVIELLAARGYATTLEQARHYIDTQKIKGRTVEEIRANKEQFQLQVLNLQIEEESKLDINKITFLDRALPDAMAYYEFLGLKYDDRLIKMCNTFCYQKVFILDRLPLINDYARLEDEEEQIRIHHLIIDVYKRFPCPVEFVPVLPPEERVDFILQNL